MRSGLALVLVLLGASAGGEPRPAWVAANFAGDPPAALMRSREGWLRWTGLWGTRRLQHAGLVTRVAVSPDGKWIASACEDGTVRLSEARDGKEIRTLRTDHAAPGLAVSPDGRRIYTGDFAGIRAWDAATGFLLASWPLGSDIHGLRLSSDGRLLAYWGKFGFQIRDAMTLNFATTAWPGQSDEPVRDAVFSPDGRRLVTCGYGNLVTSWEVSSGATTSFAGPEDEEPSFERVAVDPGGEEVAASWKSGEILRWKLETGEGLPSLGAGAETIAFSPDGTTIATGGSAGVCIWDRATGKCLRECGANDPVSSIAFAPDGTWLVTGHERGAVRIWLTATGAERGGEERLPHDVSSLAVSADGMWAAAALWTEVRIWDAATGAVRGRFSREDRRTLAVAATPDGRVVSDWGHDAGGDWESRVTIWDPVTGEDLVAPYAPLGWGASIALAPRGGWIAAAADWDQIVYVWDLGSGRLLRTLRSDSPLAMIATSPDGSQVAAASVHVPGKRESTIHLWGADSETARLKLSHDWDVVAVCLSPDGSRVAGASADGTVRLWSTKDGAATGVLRGHAEAVRCVVWSEDGRWIVSGGEDGFVRVWHATTGKEADLIQVDGMPLVLVLRKDRLHVGCRNRTVCVYEWKPPE